MALEALAVLVPFLLFGALVAGLAILGWRMHRKRVEALRAFAAQSGWGFVELDRSERPGRYAGFQPFGQGSSRKALCCLVTPDGREAFEYRYTVQSGKSSHTYVLTVAAATMPLGAPRLSVRREGWGLKLLDALGGEDIDFESHEFSRRFWVRCEDRRFAYDVFHPALMELWMARGERWLLQWQGRTLLLVAPRRMDLAAAQEALALAADVRASLPRHLLAAQRP